MCCLWCVPLDFANHYSTYFNRSTLCSCFQVTWPVAVPLSNVLLAGPRLFFGVHLVLPPLYLAAHPAELPLHAHVLGLRHRSH
jgi:hypothetical protein